jgi:hypothetical protein
MEELTVRHPIQYNFYASKIMRIHRITLFLLMLTALICLAGCEGNGGDALSKYKRVEQVSHFPKAISDDVQNYIKIKKIPFSGDEIPMDGISTIEYFEDGTGGYAVLITQEIAASQNQKTLDHILYYDKNNSRTKVKIFHGKRGC